MYIKVIIAGNGVQMVVTQYISNTGNETDSEQLRVKIFFE